uniref:Transcription repressor n=1 Tax=Oryza glumipatula TaxID=40148 RepID=A0A0D9YB73_9ORYZ
MQEDNISKKAKLRKSIQLFLSRNLKKIPPIHIPSSAIPAKITSNRLLSTCRFPRTPSLHGGGGGGGDHRTTDDDDGSNGRDQAATLSDVDRFLFDNFRSLYIHDGDNHQQQRQPPPSPGKFTQPAAAETSSSRSESVAEDARGTSSGDEDDDNSSTAIMLFSVDPYTDFRISMQNIIEMHHGEEPQPLDWDFLEELLFYYLQLNEQSVHKYILKAFADLTAGAHVSCPARGKPQWADKSVRSRKHY